MSSHPARQSLSSPVSPITHFAIIEADPDTGRDIISVYEKSGVGYDCLTYRGLWDVVITLREMGYEVLESTNQRWMLSLRPEV